MGRSPAIAVLLAVPLTLASAGAAPASGGSGPGGTQADPGRVGAPPAGGAEFGSALRRLPGKPRVRALRLASATVSSGRSASLLVRVQRTRASSVRVAVRIAPRRGAVRSIPARRIRAGRTVRLALPAALRPGAYRVSVVALAGAGEPSVRSASVRLTVKAKPKPKPKPRPKPRPRRPSGSPPPPPRDLGSATSGVFPVRGPHTFGGSGSRFGAGRPGHIHQGQDIAAASGTPVVAPLAGSVLFNDYQAEGAGRYVVMAADNGWHMFFAHCLAGSATVRPGQRVRAGDLLCRVGSTGDSSGPHLHFELWPNGWRHIRGTRPIDPLPQLRRWAR